MKLNVVYQSNKTGNKLVEELTQIGCKTISSEFEIEGTLFLDIMLQDNDSKQHRILNSPMAIKTAQNREILERILRINRIYCSNSEDIPQKIYDVLVFDLDILSIRIRVPGREKEKTSYTKQSDNSRIPEIARKVLLLTGLDFAVISIMLNSRRRLKVIKVIPSPSLRAKDLSRLANRLKLINDALPVDAKLGADPEFMMANSKTGKMISASRFFPKDGIVGCDNIRMPNRQQRPVGELRPRPESCPHNLVKNIEQALKSANQMAPHRNVKWVAGSQPFPGFSIGGHIHFSRINLNAALIRALDNYLGISTFLIENPYTASRRRKKYGTLGDYREKNHGGFEYRTPGSWLISKEITTAIIILAKIVANNCYALRRNCLNKPEAQQAFYDGNQEYYRKVFPQFWEDIISLEDYKKYSEELGIIPMMIANEVIWDEKTDLRKAWNITGAASPRRGGKKNPVDSGRSDTADSQNTGNNPGRSQSSNDNRDLSMPTMPAARSRGRISISGTRRADRGQSNTARAGSIEIRRPGAIIVTRGQTAPGQIRRTHHIR